MKKILFLSFVIICGFKSFSQTLASDTIDILHYEINLNLIDLSTKTIQGNTEIYAASKMNNISILSLDLLKMNIDSVRINGIAQNNYSYNDTVLRIQLSQSLNQNDSFYCRIYYHGIPVVDASGWGGFYFQADGSYAYNMGVGMTANPHAYGRTWFPCHDDFVDKSTFDFNITTNLTNTAVCNGLLISTSINPNSTKTWHWRILNEMNTYLASLSVGSYVCLSDSFNSSSGSTIPIRIYTRPADSSAALVSFQHLKQMMNAYEFYWGPYRWERIGYVGVPFNSGAMEHTTTISLGFGYMTGGLTYESLIAHELSHHWFGDLVTCSSEGDMWLNEGWATYCESLFDEYYYGFEVAKNTRRSLILDVMKNAHLQDGGYISLANVPHSLTYGSTVYNKGATVAHSLRGYIGDSLFFASMKQYFTDKAYLSVSSDDFKTYLEIKTGKDLDPFFNAWVKSPGFMDYSIDSIKIFPLGQNYKTEIFVKQKLRQKPGYADSSRVWVKLLGSQWQQFNALVTFGGNHGSSEFIVPFYPVSAMLDFDEKISDASIDFVDTLRTIGLISHIDANFKLDIKQISDSAIIRVTHHWVAPDSMEWNHSGFRFSKSHYWTIGGLSASGNDFSGRFQYSRTTFDSDILLQNTDSLVLFYRKDASENWQYYPHLKSGTFQAGFLIADHLKFGDYAIGAWDKQYVSVSTESTENQRIIISPNPGSSLFKIQLVKNDTGIIQIFDSSGKLVQTINTIANEKDYIWNSENVKKGVYYVIFKLNKSGMTFSEKLIKQ